MKLSCCLIVRNEEPIIERCLSCLSFADEVVVVDTGSDDRTKEIAAKYGKVYSFEWVDDFAAARNFSFSKATGDYILWCDADDVFPDSTISKLETLDLTADAYYLPYNVAFDEQDNPILSYHRERIVRRSCGFQWQEPVHEHLAVSGNIQYLDIPIEHRPGHKPFSTRNLDIYRKMEAEGKEFSARASYYYARELKDHQLWCAAMAQYQDFLSRPDGWVEDKINACIGLSEVYIARGQTDDALAALNYSFTFDLPRPETCCRIGNVYFEQGDMERAAFWYNLALNVPEPTSGFVYQDYCGLIPHLQLCVCCDRLGKREEAVQHNEKAAGIKPHHPSVIHNRDYFESLIEDN